MIFKIVAIFLFIVASVQGLSLGGAIEFETPLQGFIGGLLPVILSIVATLVWSHKE